MADSKPNSWEDDTAKTHPKDTGSYSRSISTDSSASDKVSDMSLLVNRLASFKNWPDEVITSAAELTECGMFYTGKKDQVQCFECGVKIRDWKQSDSPMYRHREASPACKFLALKDFQSPGSGQGANNFPEEASVISKNLNTSEEKPNDGIFKSETKSMGNTNNGSESYKKVVVVKDNTSKNPKDNVARRHEEENPNPSTSQNTGQTVLMKSNHDVLNEMSRQDNSAEHQQWFTPRNNQSTTQQLPNERPDYTIESNRLASFVGNWPVNAPVSPRDLADAGLYYTGPGDRVQCAWCRGGLYNFEEGDTPIGEHIRHFGECSFIKNKVYQMMNVSTSPNTQPQRTPSVPAPNNGSTMNLEDLPAVKIAKEMGYSLQMIRRALDKISPRKDTYKSITSEQLVEVLFDMETDDDHEELEEVPDINDDHVDVLEAPEESGATTSLQGSFTDKPRADLMKLKEENDELKGKTICKICLDRPVDMLFLPCRHLVCCEECGNAVRQCPVCRTAIIGTVKTFLS